MKIYLVGGAVRDILLDIAPKDKDWVVIGTNEKEMLALGFKKVGSSFPVFIHPDTKEEYALARKEKKIGKGYYGFETTFDKSVTLEDDLLRRDLTINSIAMTDKGEIIDPFNGAQDIKKRILRHTSLAFTEDSLRVIRIARFKAQLSDFNFKIAKETEELCIKIANSGELIDIKKERINIEFIKSLKNPKIFFNSLKTLHGLEILFPLIRQQFSKLPRKIFFISDTYQKSNIETKIALTFFSFAPKDINKLKTELCLTNNQSKIIHATCCLFQISKTVSHDEILFLLKQSNILRNNILLQKTKIIMGKLKELKNLNNLEDKINSTFETISELLKLNYSDAFSKTSHTDKNMLAKTLQLNIIKKHFKL
ncbi:tRNA CCA-pyrophosphorylase [Pseudofrancisella aestuarii]|uniref:tRNA CCA-pyrophosphorylase n=1 Tax=Pseudofrancisella aestuarii TaxID=2670347 RepID=A0ABV9TCU8_9GAMM|nr:tRNA CCA-pyrophosphorylase [Pseudofrancisella aestuarii]